MIRLLCCTLLTILFFFGCSSQEPEIPEHLQQLQNLMAYSVELDPAHEIELVHEGVYGDTDEVFLGQVIRSVAVDEQGRVYVADISGGTIHVYESDGAYITSVGQSGQGPGEFQGILEIDVDDHQLHVLDHSQKISVFNLNSFSHIKDLDISLGESNNDPSWASWVRDQDLFYSASNFYIRSDGNYLVIFSDDRVIRTDNVDGRTYEIALYNPEAGKFIDHDILSFRWSSQVLVHEENGLRLDLPNVPYKRSSRFDFANGVLIHGHTDEMLFMIHDENGDYLRSIYYPFANATLLEDDVISIFEEHEPSVQAIRNDELPETWPSFYSVIADDDDRFWISTIIEDQEIYEWWVLDGQGQLQAIFRWPRNSNLHQIRNGYAYAIEVDLKTGIHQVSRYRVQIE